MRFTAKNEGLDLISVGTS